MKLTVHDATGKEIETIDVDDAVFDIEPNKPVVHQALVTAQANKRAGTATTMHRTDPVAPVARCESTNGSGVPGFSRPAASRRRPSTAGTCSWTAIE